MTSSSTYPITEQSIKLEHKGGTKAYTIRLFTRADGHTVLVFRWGKKGSFGDILVQDFASSEEADKAAAKKLEAKMKGGYAIVDGPSQRTASSRGELRGIMGRPLLSKIGPDALKILDPDFDTTGMRDRELPRLDEEGRLNQETLREKEARERREVMRAREEAARQEREAAEVAYKDNPLFGAF